MLDKDDAFAGRGGPPGDASPRRRIAGPDPAKLTAIVEEFLRQQAIFPAAVVARGDWLLGVVGVRQVRLLLYQLFAEADQPLPPMGVKQWSAKLAPAAGQLQLLSSPATARQLRAAARPASLRSTGR